MQFTFIQLTKMQFELFVFETGNGGDNRFRTDGLLLAKQVLPQLSYIPISVCGVYRTYRKSDALLFT